MHSGSGVVLLQCKRIPDSSCSARRKCKKVLVNFYKYLFFNILFFCCFMRNATISAYNRPILPHCNSFLAGHSQPAGCSFTSSCTRDQWVLMSSAGPLTLSLKLPRLVASAGCDSSSATLLAASWVSSMPRLPAAEHLGIVGVFLGHAGSYERKHDATGG